MIHKRNNLSEIARAADAAGLSYGRYVAQERAKRTPHRKPPANYLSINDRKKHGIGTPIYCGTTTITKALPYDCPRTVDRLIETHIAYLPALPKGEKT